MNAILAGTRAPVALPDDLLTLDNLGTAGLARILQLASEVKADPSPVRGSLAGGRLGMLFDKPSTRTRVSFETAAWTLVMLPSLFRPDELQLGRGETIADTAHTLSLYLDALVVRTFAQARVEELADVATIPVINALTNEHHPCQALADLMTIEEEFGTFAGIEVAFVGDGDNVCHSLIQGAALTGLTLRVATPPHYEPDAGIVAAAREQALLTGGSIHLTSDPREAVSGAEVVYADVWTSMGREGEQETRRRAFAGYRVDADLMACASRAAIFLHCLPAHRGEEVTDEVIDGPQSRVWRQAENRLHTETALLYALLHRDRAAAAER
jgi:ornithine carbamoyltransferase